MNRRGLILFLSKIAIGPIPGYFLSVTILTSLGSLHGLPDGGIILDLSLTSSPLIYVMVLNSSKHITNLLTLRKSFLPFTFIVQSSFIPWVFQWYLDYSINNGVIVLQRKFKVKWWNSYKIPDKISKSAIEGWL